MFSSVRKVVVLAEAVAEPPVLFSYVCVHVCHCVCVCVCVCVNPMARLDCEVHSCACGCRQSSAQ